MVQNAEGKYGMKATGFTSYIIYFILFYLVIISVFKYIFIFIYVCCLSFSSSRIFYNSISYYNMYHMYLFLNATLQFVQFLIQLIFHVWFGYKFFCGRSRTCTAAHIYKHHTNLQLECNGNLDVLGLVFVLLFSYKYSSHLDLNWNDVFDVVHKICAMCMCFMSFVGDANMYLHILIASYCVSVHNKNCF